MAKFLSRGVFNAVVDLQWGSCGKGLVASYLAEHEGVTHCSSNNQPNAGHTAVYANGEKFIAKVLPVVSYMNKLGRPVRTFLGGGAGFRIDRLLEELKLTEIPEGGLSIHPRATVVTDEDAATERGETGSASTKHIASTMQGSGWAAAKKLMRLAGNKLARDYAELSPFLPRRDFCDMVEAHLSAGALWLHEGSQGFSLGINHGSHYPQCTSRDCGVAREMSDMGVNPRLLGEVVGVLRPYPIRVGNVVEDGKEVGHSGDCYKDQVEVRWEDVRKACNGPEDLGKGELTTVTKRLRRVFTFSPSQVRQACTTNGVSALFINFANYIDWPESQSIKGKGQIKFKEIPKKIRTFAEQVNLVTGVQVKWLGVGPATTDVVEIR